MTNKDLPKEILYEGVKTLLETDHPHIHLPQQKLYTLFSLAFQYMLYRSQSEKGHYLIRVESSYVLDKLIKRSKDESTRKFLQKVALPRKLSYQGCYFHLDFFNMTTWATTNEIPKQKIKGAIIVKGTGESILTTPGEDALEADIEYFEMMRSLPKTYYIDAMTQRCPKTITIAFNQEIDTAQEVRFPFIKEKLREDIVDGVKLNVDLDDI